VQRGAYFNKPSIKNLVHKDLKSIFRYEDNGNFMLFSLDAQLLLNAARSSGQQTYMMQSWVYDFTKMTQTNTLTGTVRQIYESPYVPSSTPFISYQTDDLCRYERYPSNVVTDIIAAYENGQSTYMYSNYKIDFNTMTQTNVHTNKVRNIIVH
jgi:hypothetical protein